MASMDEAEPTIVGAATNLTSKIESGRSAISERDKLLAGHEAKLSSLTEELEALKAQPRPPIPPPKDENFVNEELNNLRRENKLIVSAWYDLTQRLQSNTVMLARRQEPPKSWIGRQRVAVGSGGGGGSGGGRR
jgi:protein HOOK3